MRVRIRLCENMCVCVCVCVCVSACVILCVHSVMHVCPNPREISGSCIFVGLLQEISARMVCVKGIGQDHAKFSPVSTTSYRLLTDVRVNHDLVTGHLAEKLVEMCPVGVFELEDGHAIPAHPRKCTLCRECIRHEGWEDRVQISRNKKHFICLSLLIPFLFLPLQPPCSESPLHCCVVMALCLVSVVLQSQWKALES